MLFANIKLVMPFSHVTLERSKGRKVDTNPGDPAIKENVTGNAYSGAPASSRFRCNSCRQSLVELDPLAVYIY